MHRSLLQLLLAVLVCSCALAGDVTLVTFDNNAASSTTHAFTQKNDPVMGGKSTGTWSVDAKNKVGVFEGDVVDVPFLKAPGFIKAQAADSKFPDISSCGAIVLKARSSTPYGGYRLSFGNKKGGLLCSFFSRGYKARFAAPTGYPDFQNVVLPFAEFSDCNSDSTGEPKKLCRDDKSVCPDATTLKDIETVSIWAEGVSGKVHLEIESISATGCNNDNNNKNTTTNNNDAARTASSSSATPEAIFLRGNGDSASGAGACAPVQTAKNFSLDSYINNGRWYIQQQATTTYLPKKENYCVFAEYERLPKKSFWGYTVQVHNYAQEANGKAHDSKKFICARVDSKYGNDESKLTVGPCFLPRFSGFTTGPYWVLYHDAAAGLAVVSGGQPTIQTPNGCRTGSGVNNAGLWIFTHAQERNEALVAKGRNILQSQGYDLSVLNDVDQTPCK